MTVPKVPEGVEPAQTRRNQPFEGIRRGSSIIGHARARGGDNGKKASDAFDPFAACPIADPANALAVRPCR